MKRVIFSSASRVIFSTLLAALFCVTPPAYAEHCGDADCGDDGVCQEESLIAKCDCVDQYVSVLTFFGTSSQGAFCVPLPALPDAPGCEDFACEPHGVCVVDEGGAGRCLCDLGFREDGVGGCEDDPGDDAEAACAAADCGMEGTCMATPDAITCRCKPGDYTVMGSGAEGGLGPVCVTPPNPETACGPDECGPWGECVILQAITCRCEPGATVDELRGSDGRMHPFCVDPERPFTIGEEGEDVMEGTISDVTGTRPTDQGGGEDAFSLSDDISSGDGGDGEDCGCKISPHGDKNGGLAQLIMALVAMLIATRLRGARPGQRG